MLQSETTPARAVEGERCAPIVVTGIRGHAPVEAAAGGPDPAGSHRFVVAPDKFKGSLSAVQAAQAIIVGLRRRWPTAEFVAHPVADGGDGMVEGLLQHGFTARSVVVDDALGRPIEAAYARAGTLAVIELAAASGLQQIAVDDRDPLQASTFGTGQLIRHAIDAGASSIVVGTGGSATTDGGAGMLAALGARMLDADGREITRVPRDLDRVHRVDLTGLVTGPADLVVTVAADVENPLLGLEGAVQVFGLQKGVSPDLAPFLEESLTRWADAVEGAVGGRIRDVPGAGAAGGTAFALAAAYGASIRSGIEIFLNISKFADVLRGASLVVTGEGTLDDQTLSGKAPLGVSKAAGAASIPTIAIAGMNLLSPAKARKAGLAAVYSLSDIEPDPERSMRHASRLLAAVAEQVGRDIADTLTTLAHDGDAAVAN